MFTENRTQAMQTATRVLTIIFFVLFALTACKKAENDVAPERTMSYFDGYYFEPKAVDDDENRIMFSLCKGTAEPENLEVGVYNFGPETNGDDALIETIYPGNDEDGEPLDMESPDNIVYITTKYNDPYGEKLSDYDTKKRFPIDVDRNGVSVIVIEKETGFWAGWVKTTSWVNGSEACLTFFPRK